ncbi:hypothetical protein FD755_009417, partial [Muntiacus reevesi]
TMEMILDKKQIQAIFFKSKFRMGHKAVETTCNAFGQGTANEQYESPENEQHSDWSVEVDKDQLRVIIEADSLTTTREVAEELNIDHSVAIWHLKQIGKVKKLNKWMPHELTLDQQNRHFEMSSSLIVRNNELFLCQIVTRNEDGWTEKKPQSTSQSQNLHQKKIMVTLWWSAADLIHFSFLNPGKTILSQEYAQQPAFVNRKDPILLHDKAQLHVAQPTLQKLNELGCGILPYLPCSPDLLSSSYHSFKHLGNFLQGKWFHNQHQAENAFQEFFESFSMDFYTIGINRLISCWQGCVDCNGSYFH